MEDSTLLTFKAITNFVKDLSDVFGKMQKSLALYARLLEKTGIMHTGPIQKHIETFKNFCISNREAIKAKDITKFEIKRIVYSEDRVYIDIPHVFKMADKETREVIWQHLLTITALVDPGSNAKKILKESIERKEIPIPEDAGDEGDFLKSLISKVENSIDPESVSDNPMEVVQGLMSSGVFNDLLGSMQDGLSNGKLDLSKLLGTVNGMMNNLKNEDGSSVEMPAGMPDLSSMMGMVQGLQNGGGGGGMGNTPNPMNMMSMMSSMMGGLNLNANIPSQLQLQNPTLEVLEEKEDENTQE